MLGPPFQVSARPRGVAAPPGPLSAWTRRAYVEFRTLGTERFSVRSAPGLAGGAGTAELALGGDGQAEAELRRGADRGRQAGDLGGAGRLRGAAPGRGAGAGVREALQSLHLGQSAHGARPRLLDRRRLRALPPRPRGRRAARIRLRRLRPAGG